MECSWGRTLTVCAASAYRAEDIHIQHGQLYHQCISHQKITDFNMHMRKCKIVLVDKW